jgi:hypothetical protein
MDYINANAYAGVKLKVISNLHYPGYNADNVQSTCKDATTGATINMRDKFLPKLATMNYWMCEYARQKGFQCADNFAQYMGADYDSNGDGQVDADALALCGRRERGELPDPHHGHLKPTMRDANTHFVSASSSYDYIQSDDTHPTYTGGTVTAGLFGGTTGSGAPRYTSFTGGKSPIWNQYGHERMGWAVSPDLTIRRKRKSLRGAARGQRVGLVPVWRRFAARSDRGGSPSPAFHPLCR